MKIYTKTGDKGSTALFGGTRVDKDDLRIEAYGTIDELNSYLGLAFNHSISMELKDDIRKIQNILFTVGSDLATPLDFDDSSFKIPRTEKKFTDFLEIQIDYYSNILEELQNFILPGGSEGAALLHIARTICRRAERLLVSAKKTTNINENNVIFLNRLSDYLFVAARYENKQNKTPDIKWEIS